MTGDGDPGTVVLDRVSKTYRRGPAEVHALRDAVPGLAVGCWVSAQLMASFSGDLFDFGMEMRGSTLVLSSVAIVVVATLAQWSTARTVARLDLARVVRERSS